MSSERLLQVPYGPAATSLLRAVIDDLQHGDPLAPVSVAAPSTVAGLALRRTLGFDGGLANVHFDPLVRLAELLGAPALARAGRTPLTMPLRSQALRAALAEAPGGFRDVAAHPATERSLDRTFADLRLLSPPALERLAAAGPRSADVVRLFRATYGRLAAYADHHDVVSAAAAAVRSGVAALRDLGHVVVFLPERLTPAETDLVAALAQQDRLTVVVGSTGDPLGDEPAGRLLDRLRPLLGEPAGEPPAAPPQADRIIVAADASEEVRVAARHAMDRLAAGTPLHRLAILYPTPHPYARLLVDGLAAAGIPFNGPGVRTLADTLAGRCLAGLLAMADTDFRRDAVTGWLASAPVREVPGSPPVPASRWDALSRKAGVVSGAGQWQERLARHRQAVLDRIALLDDEAEATSLRRLRRNVEETERLARFVADLVTAVDPGERRTWSDLAAWAAGLLRRYLPVDGSWPDEEQEAHRQITDLLEHLPALDAVEGAADVELLRRELDRELDAPLGRVGRFGHGVFVGAIREAVAGTFDEVVVVGMAEGIVPRRVLDDPLLRDDERAPAGDAMPLQGHTQAQERRDFLAALAAAPARVLVCPRADQRSGREAIPSRWVLATASAHHGSPVFSTGLEAAGGDWLETVPSYAAAVEADGDPASPQDWDLRSLLRHRTAGRSLHGHPLVAAVPHLHDALRLHADRGSRAFTRWDGRVGADPLLAPAPDRPLSATRLEQYAACPFRYFLGQVLGVAEPERPEEITRIAAVDRGKLVHQVLHRFLDAAPPRQSPDQRWSDEERDLLRSIADDVCADFEAGGLTGKRVLWEVDRRGIIRDLEGFLDADERERATRRLVPADAELGFGSDDAAEPALAVTLGQGDAITFRGAIDRVDVTPGGERAVVYDYKTGSASRYDGLDDDPLRRGQLLQLPLYALAAARRHDVDQVWAGYWFISEAAAYSPVGYEVDEQLLAAFRSTLGELVGGIRSGLFPARPGAPTYWGWENCGFCPFDSLCPTTRQAAWERKRDADELASYRTLAEPDEDGLR